MPFQRFAYTLFLVMKITFYQFALLTVFSITSYANRIEGQSLLNSRVSITVAKSPIKEVIPNLEKQTGAKFSYSSDAIDLNSIISCRISNLPLGDFLNQYFKTHFIDYRVLDNEIIMLFPKRKEISKLSSMLENHELYVNQKEIIVTGLVKDDKGGALQEVIVTEKGTNNKVITNSSGEFKIKVKDIKAALIFTHIGFNEQLVFIKDNKTINISLFPSTKILDDVVVVSVGYGTSKKKDVTGSVVSVAVNDLKKAPVASFEEALGGRAAGVQVTSQSGQPGDGFQISIRGNNSVTQSNTPLYVIDGFPIEGFNNSLINPAEIESIDVLKDASATAIYGARGANGVVIITTKRGKEGPPQISYQGYVGGIEVTKKLELLNPYEFVKLQLEINPSPATAQYLTRSKRTLEDYKSIEGVNLQDKIFQRALMQSHYLNVRGGSANTKYSFSGNYFKQDGIIINSGYHRYQLSSSIDQNLNAKLKAGVNITLTATKVFGTITAANAQNSSERGTSPTGYLMYNLWGFRPTTGDSADYVDELIDPDLPVSNISYPVNPYVQVQNELREKLEESNIINAYIEWNPFKFLKFRSTYGVNRLNSTQNNFNNSKTSSGNPVTSPNSIFVNGSVANGKADNWSNENTITYTNTFNKIHSLTVLAGITAQGGSTSSGGFRAIQVPNESLGISGLDEGTVSALTSTSSLWTLASFLTRVNYAYKSKYLFTANFRSDGSSRFSDGNKWAYFPSGSVAWRFTEEGFLKSALSFLNDGKLRVGYGQTGNNRVNDFSYLSVLTTSGINNTYSFNNGTPGTSAVSSTVSNRNLKWETTEQSNIGIDLSLLKRKLQITVDAYNKITRDLLINAPVERNSGYFNILQNVGMVKNYGLEFTVSYKVFDDNNIKWNSSFNISFNRNKVLALADNQEAISFNIGDRIAGASPVNISKVGYPIGAFNGYLWDGVYQFSDFDKLANNTYRLKSNVAALSSAGSNIQPGDIKFRDLNGDLVVNASDNTIIGNPNPNHYGGLSNNFTYKNFDLNIFFQWSYGNDIANVNRTIFEGGGEFPANLNQYKSVVNRWTPENPNPTIPRFRPGTNNYSFVHSSRTIEDGSYLRLKTISLAYNINKKVLKKLSISNAQFYASAQNLITWTKYTGYDPEVSVSNNSLAPGIDFSAYPRNRTVIIGINLTF